MTTGNVLYSGAIAAFLHRCGRKVHAAAEIPKVSSGERGKASEIDSIFEGDKRKQFSLADYA